MTVQYDEPTVKENIVAIDERIVIHGLLKGTCFSNVLRGREMLHYTDVLSMLEFNYRGSVPITITKEFDRNSDCDTEIVAHRISLYEWQLVKRLCKYYERHDEEGSTFSFHVVKNATDIRWPQCNAPIWLATQTTKHLNWIQEDADTWASMCNVKAERVYAFWIEDLNKFGVVYMPFWVL